MRLLLFAFLIPVVWGQCVQVTTKQSYVFVTPTFSTPRASVVLSSPTLPSRIDQLIPKSQNRTSLVVPTTPAVIFSNTIPNNIPNNPCTNTLKTITKVIPIPWVRSRTITQLSMVTTTATVQMPGTFLEHTILPPPRTVISKFQSLFSLMSVTTSACDPSKLCVRICPGQEGLHDGALDIMAGHRCCESKN